MTFDATTLDLLRNIRLEDGKSWFEEELLRDFPRLTATAKWPTSLSGCPLVDMGNYVLRIHHVLAGAVESSANNDYIQQYVEEELNEMLHARDYVGGTLLNDKLDALLKISRILSQAQIDCSNTWRTVTQLDFGPPLPRNTTSVAPESSQPSAPHFQQGGKSSGRQFPKDTGEQVPQAYDMGGPSTNTLQGSVTRSNPYSSNFSTGFTPKPAHATNPTYAPEQDFTSERVYGPAQDPDYFPGPVYGPAPNPDQDQPPVYGPAMNPDFPQNSFYGQGLNPEHTQNPYYVPDLNPEHTQHPVNLPDVNSRNVSMPGQADAGGAGLDEDVDESDFDEDEQLKKRGKRKWTCRLGFECRKGGVENGELKVFSRHCDIRAHKDMHDKPYKCDLSGCGARFARKDQLARHKKDTKGHKRK